MRKPLLLALSAAAGLALSLVASRVWAQGAAPARPAAARSAPPTSIALLDVSQIFQQLPRFKQMMEELKGDIDRAEAEVKKERDAIQKLMQSLNGFKGTPDYKRIEEEITKRQSDLAVRVNLQKKEFVLREARIYHNIYKEIQQEVDYFCRANGIDLVMRFSGDVADPEQPDSVLAYINRPVVTHAQDLNITPVILKELQRRYETRGPVTPGPARIPGLQR